MQILRANFRDLERLIGSRWVAPRTAGAEYSVIHGKVVLPKYVKRRAQTFVFDRAELIHQIS